MAEDIVDFGTEPEHSRFRIKKENDNVNPYDILRLAKGILIVASAIYVSLALTRIFYTAPPQKIKA